MLSYFELRRGVQFIYEDEPYEVLEFKQMGKAQDVVVAQTKIRNLINGKVLEKTFHQEDKFDEAELTKVKMKFIYSHPDNGRDARYIATRYRKSSTSNGASRNRFFFCEIDNPSKRIDLGDEQVGYGVKFLKANEIVETLVFDGKIISVSLPIKVLLKVTDAPPGLKGDRAQGGLKTVVLETGASINVPLFVETDDIIEVNTETGEYTRRAE